MTGAPPQLSKQQKDEMIKEFITQKYVHKKWVSEAMTRRHYAVHQNSGGGGSTPNTPAAGSSGGGGGGASNNSGGAQLSAADERNLELHEAAYTEDLETMLCLLAHPSHPVDVNWCNPQDQNRTALHKCAENDSVLCAELLIQNNAKPNVEDKEKMTPLAVARSAGKHELTERLEKLAAKK